MADSFEGVKTHGDSSKVLAIKFVEPVMAVSTFGGVGVPTANKKGMRVLDLIDSNRPIE